MSNWRDRKPTTMQQSQQSQSPSPTNWRDRGALASNSAGASPSSLNTVQETPDFISAGQRAIAKNFANSTEAQLKYYQQEHPDKEFSMFDGEVVARAKGDAQWKQIDPDTGIFSKDILHDIGDILYETGAGALQGIATTAGFLAGSPTGIGAPLAAAGASAASGATLEGARQGIGKLAGIPQDIDKTNVAVAGALGAVAPGIFGVNKMPGVVNKTATMFGKNGLFNMTAQQEAKSSGLIKRGIDYVGPRAVQFATGIAPETQATYRASKDRLQSVAQNNGQFELVDNLTNKVQKVLGDRQTELGKKVGTAIDTANGPVDISKAKQVFADRLTFLKSKPYITNAEQAEISSLENYYGKYFGLAEPYTNYTQANSVPSTSRAVSIFNQPGQQVGPTGSGPSIDMAKNTFTELPDKITGQRAFDLQHKLKQAAAFETNMTPETLSAKGSARGAYHNINQGLEDATSGLSQEAKNNYSNFKVIGDEVEKNFNSPQRTFNTINALDKNGKMSLVSRLRSLSDNGVLNIEPEVNDIKALNAYYGMGESPLVTAKDEQVRTGLGTVLGSLGTYLGYKAGGGGTSGAVGAGIGLGAGLGLAKKAASKEAARFYNNLGQAIDKAQGVNYLSNPAYYQSNTSSNPWFRDEKKQP